MNLQSENLALIKSNTPSRIENQVEENSRPSEWERASEKPLVDSDMAATNPQEYSLSTWYFGSSCRTTSPKTQELMTRHAALGATENNSLKQK